MSRRGRGEGTIYPVRDATGKTRYWAAQISLGWRAGKRVRKNLRAETRAEVVKKLAQVQRDRDAGFSVKSDERETLGQYLTRWLEVVGPSVRPRSLVNYQIAVKNHIVPELGSTRLTALTTDDVQIFLNRKLDVLSPKSVSNLRGTLRAALNHAVETGQMARNPVLRTKPPAPKPRKLRVLDQDEAHRLLEAAKGDRNYALYAVALAMGLRLGEALGLRWEDIDAEKLHVRHSLQRINGSLVLSEPKTEKSVRSIKMPAMIVSALAEHRKVQHQSGIVSPYVFTTWRGTPIDPRNALRQFKELLEKAGLPDTIRFHDLRHSCATLLLARGLNVKVIAELLGHSNPVMLLTTYSHVLPQMRDQAASEMDEVLGR